MELSESEKERLAKAQLQVDVFNKTIEALKAEKYADVDRRELTNKARNEIHNNRGNNGFTFTVIVPDRRGRKARIVMNQAGDTWACVPGREAGMGAKARNEWAAKHAAKTYHQTIHELAMKNMAEQGIEY